MYCRVLYCEASCGARPSTSCSPVPSSLLPAPSLLEPSPPSPIAARSSAEWLDYFRANTAAFADVPWETAVRLTPPERDAVAASIQEFQLGESSEGRHLHAAARAHAAETGDDAYVAAIEAFIREEQRHARQLGRFLAAEGIPLRKRSWADDVFRALRRGASLETTVSVLLTAELIAQVYYAALREATDSPLLRALCERVLRDEAAHVRFQAERLAALRENRARVLVIVAVAVQRALLAAVVPVVWWGHRSALRRGGLTLPLFWRRCHARFEAVAPIMTPRSHRRGEQREDALSPETRRRSGVA